MMTDANDIQLTLSALVRLGEARVELLQGSERDW